MRDPKLAHILVGRKMVVCCFVVLLFCCFVVLLFCLFVARICPILAYFFF